MNEPVDVQIRITTVGYQTRYKSSVIGVETDTDGVRLNRKKLFLISANRELMAVTPEVGQVWKVTGLSSSKDVVKDGYKRIETRISAESMKLVLPASADAFATFVANQKDFKGIGDKKARILWKTFGENLFFEIKMGNRSCFREFLTEDSITALFNGFEKYKALEHVEFFAENGIPKDIIQRVFKKHKHNIRERIEADPYLLLTFGLKWDTVDDIARSKFSITEDAKIRLSAAIEASLLEESKNLGNTVISQDSLRSTLKTKLKNEALITQALTQKHETGAFAVSIKGYHPAGTLIMESVVAKRLMSRRYQTPNESGENIIASEAYKRTCEEMGMSWDSDRPPTPQQVDAVVSSNLNYIMALSGGAGTGKTTTLGLITRTLYASGVDVHGVALSGRAAKRMTEATGFKAKTIAKFLRSPYLRGEKRTILIIDEASMLDTQTMYKIVTHVSSDVQILFVGDFDQLPPIGPGHVLRDIIGSGVIETIRLDVVKRQKGDSGIPAYSRLIRDGIVPESLSSGQVFFHDVDDDDINSKCVDLLCDEPESTMIVGATYESPNGGIDVLNSLAQERLNKDGDRWEFKIDGINQHLNIYKNDPVIFTANDYDADVQNGTLARLISPEQTVNGFGVVETDAGESISITQSLLESLKLAYAISLHKAQGSQFKRVIVPISATKMVDRNWLYTAVTRCEMELHIVGPEARFRKAIERESSSSNRQTYLKELLIAEGSLGQFAEAS